jgi:hypothetical protein
MDDGLSLGGIERFKISGGHSPTLPRNGTYPQHINLADRAAQADVVARPIRVGGMVSVSLNAPFTLS